MTLPPGLTEIKNAAARIAPHVRRTPAMRIAPGLTLHLECLQVAGSFKPRGAFNTMLQLAPETLARGVATASGGNHGLAVAYAAKTLAVPATIYVPASTGEAKRAAIASLGATVTVHGDVWDEADIAARAHAEKNGLAYVHPFADPRVIAGQGTLGLDILAATPSPSTILVAIGGGGLAAGVGLAIKASAPHIRLIGVEPTGAPTLHHSLAAGHPIRLDRIETRAGTLAPRATDALNFAIIRDCFERVVLVEDEAMREAARFLWRDVALATELSGAATVAALRTGAYTPTPGEDIVAIVCGAGTDGFG
jgi:threonine dehydratase